MAGALDPLAQIRLKLLEVVGPAAAGVGDGRILELLHLLDGSVEEVLRSILDGLYEEDVTEEGFVFVDEEKVKAGSGSMGCGSSHNSRTSSSSSGDPQTSTEAAAMLCDMCSAKFTLMTRKKSCCECSNYFCSSCLPREQGCRTRTCSRCRVLHNSPPLRGDLMKLRVKDLQHFLAKRRINIKACVEKKDLVELVLQHSGVPGEAATGGGEETDRPARLPGSRSWEDPSIRVSDQVPLERASNFPQNYTDSSHRRDWFQEKFGPNSESSTPSDAEGPEVSIAEDTPVERFSDSDHEEEEVTNVEEFGAPEGTTNESSEDAHMADVDEIISVEVEEEEDVAISDAISAPAIPPVDDANHEEDISEEQQVKDASEGSPADEVEVAVEATSDGAVGGSGAPERPAALDPRLGSLLEEDSASTPSSPRRFANQGMVYLSEIEGIEDLRELSTKQIKELLAMNRVNFKGCVEKEELLKIVERLWRQEQRNREEGDTMEDDSMCKICMDSPIDCVMLECGHMCTCTNCGKQMAECPICRQYVVRVVKTFKA